MLDKRIPNKPDTRAINSKPSDECVALNINLGQQGVIDLVQPDGSPVGNGLTLDVRTTAKGHVQIFIHTQDTCNGPDGCQPMFEAFIGEAAKEKHEQDLADAVAARAALKEFIEGLAKDAGIPVFVMDEDGLRPFDPKKQN
jgi:hypothetical protein